ncbi:uncharacterized protein LOC101857326 [Aplysia californica]|uniref:Uncharacterized protein LOC101857326 n=1 Tax=Aplysia californica TaxID=6500 RepID=A0ABM0JLY6_APLCA|nr:uncharacterized protein LOC101857326 [Aplysia californica]
MFVFPKIMQLFVRIVLLLWVLLYRVDCLNEVRRQVFSEARRSVSSSLPMVPVDAQKELVPEGVLLTVRYHVTPGEMTFVTWQAAWKNDRLFRVMEPTTSNGFSETRLLSSPPPDNPNMDTAAVLFISSRYGVYELKFNVSGSDLTINDFPVPPVSVEPSSDIVYEEGNDAYFTATTVAADSSNSWVRLTVLDLNTGDFLTPLEARGFQNVVGRNTNSGVTQREYRISTSQRQTSGVINFSVRRSLGYSHTLQKITLTRTLVLRPSTQPGPFPPGFLTVRKGPREMVDQEGRHISFCRIGVNWCRVKCVAIGSAISSMSLNRVQPPAQEEPDYIIRTDMSKPFNDILVVTVPPLPTAGSNMTFQCQIGNGEGPNVTQEKVVKFYQKVEVVGGELTDLGGERTRISCTFKGSPRPIVTFSLSFHKAYYSLTPADGVEVHGDELMAYKTIRYARYQGRLLSVWCTGLQDLNGGGRGSALDMTASHHMNNNLPH